MGNSFDWPCGSAPRRLIAAAVAAVGCLGATIGHAERTDYAPAPSGNTVPTTQCIQEAAGFNLNCTANDVSVAGVATDEQGDRIWIIDPCQQPGDQVTFIAEFAVQLNAQDRHDIGIYFATDGDSGGDGALTSDQQSGEGCSVTVLDHETPDWVDLDGTSDPYPGEKKASGVQDTCGDIDDDHSPLYPAIEVTAVCVDSDGDGFLNLPNCVSWRQAGANELCTSADDTFPGSPSKCKCDTGFNVPVPVPAAVSFEKEVRAAGTANPWGELVEFGEPGGTAEFRLTYSFATGANTPDVVITDLIDVPYGDVADTNNSEILSTTCSVPQTLSGTGPGPLASYSCTFTVVVDGNPGMITDTVTATAMDTVGNDLSRSDTAAVKINNVPPAIDVVKTAKPDSIMEPGGQVEFEVKVTNNSETTDPVWITSITDKIGASEWDIDGMGCDVGTEIKPGETYTCSFYSDVTGNAGDSQTDTVTVAVKDDEDDVDSDADSATVSIADVPGAIVVTKTASVSSCDEPSCDVTFTVVIENQSSVDTVYIDTLKDLVSGAAGAVDLDPECAELPLTIAPSGKAQCTFSRTLYGNAFEQHTNTVTASGEDDDGQPVSDSDPATVTFNNVAPAGSVSKTVESMQVTYKVVVSNDSEAEALNLSKLEDDMFCDITTTHDAYGDCGEVVWTNCATGWIAAGGEYACTFGGVVTSTPHTNTVTATLDDDDEPATPITPSDSATASFSND